MQIEELAKTPETERNPEWELAFLANLPLAKCRLLSTSPITGPDQFPYLPIAIEAQGNETVAQVLAWLSERAIGLVVNPQKDLPDYILTYGMIWNYKETGHFTKNHFAGTAFPFIAGEPHPSYLPGYARSLIKQFLLDQGVMRPRIVVAGSGDDFELAFSLESLGNPDPKEHEGILEALSWFLPQHYKLALLSEVQFPHFVDL